MGGKLFDNGQRMCGRLQTKCWESDQKMVGTCLDDFTLYDKSKLKVYACEPSTQTCAALEVSAALLFEKAGMCAHCVACFAHRSCGLTLIIFLG